MDPTARAMRSRMAAHKRWSHTGDRASATQAARDAFLKRFEDQVDPDRKMPEDERRRCAESARKAHMLDMSLRAKRARELRKQAAENTKLAAELRTAADAIAAELDPDELRVAADVLEDEARDAS